MPVLAICRGFQELNVALGGSLHQRLSDLPARLNHSNQDHEDIEIRQGKAHDVALVEGGLLHRLAGGQRTIRVNSLHNQGIERLAASLSIEATAPDGVIEAVRVTLASGLALGVQWHPEYDFEQDALSRAIFVALRTGGACKGARRGATRRLAGALRAGSECRGVRREATRTLQPRCTFSLPPRGERQWTKIALKASATSSRAPLKEGAGKITGNEKLEAEGKFERAGGKVQEGVGKGKDHRP